MKMFLSLLILVAFLAIALSDEVVASMTNPVINADASAKKVETVRTKEEELALLKFESKPSSYYNKPANRDNEKTKYVSKRNLGAVATEGRSKYGSGDDSDDSSDDSDDSRGSNKSGKSNKYKDKCAPGGKKFGNPKYCPVAPRPPPPPPSPPVPPPTASVCVPTCKPVCTPTCNNK